MVQQVLKRWYVGDFEIYGNTIILTCWNHSKAILMSHMYSIYKSKKIVIRSNKVI